MAKNNCYCITYCIISQSVMIKDLPGCLQKYFIFSLAKFCRRICPQSVFKLDKYCTKLQRIVVLCLLIKVCVLCSVGLPGNQPTVLHQRPWAQRPVSTDCVCFFSCNFSSIPLLPVCISAALFLVIVCFFPQWRLYSETVWGSPHPGAQLHWSPSDLLRLVSPLACGEGFIPSVHVQVGFTTIQTPPHVYCYLLLHTALCSFLLFYVTTCLSELWMYENTHQPLVFSFFLFYLSAIFY